MDHSSCDSNLKRIFVDLVEMQSFPDFHPTLKSRKAFSLVELVIVVVIIGIISAIAIPRMSSSADNAAKNAVIGDQSAIQRALDLYEVEHEGVMAHVGAGTIKTLYLRLLQKTDLDGTLNDSGIYGPYINGLPENKINGLATWRRGAAAAGANTHGWRYDTNTGQIQPDHLSGATGYKSSGDSVEKVTDEIIKALP
ncbi:MAG: prepilin-type N-terminal cleavage/methylation domain-containing protein [Phycisphaerales bacterium]|nr:prepilin-type N-terminal cleavage/methylation domain-containing protein [Phycisphaerales bacterium]